MKFTLPSLKALNAVEAVGRHGSISRAAEELNVTPGAVSRQVALLEAHFGCQLFLRGQNGVHLTEKGRKFVAKISDAFGSIDDACHGFLETGQRSRLVVRALGMVTSEWLLPRLPDFHKQYPSIEVVVRTQLRSVDFDTDEADFGISAGPRPWKNAEVEYLYTPHLLPVVSGRLLQSGEKLESLDDLSNFRILHALNAMPSWAEWIASYGQEYPITDRDYWLESSAQLYHAVRCGVGIGLGQWHLLAEEIIEGRLVAPFPHLVPGRFSVYLLWPKQRVLRPEIKAFRDWIIEAMRVHEEKLKMDAPDLRLDMADRGVPIGGCPDHAAGDAQNTARSRTKPSLRNLPQRHHEVEMAGLELATMGR